MNFVAFCSIGEAIWGICGVWDFLLPFYRTPLSGYTFKTALPVLYSCAHDPNCVPVQDRGAICVWGCNLLPIQHPPPNLLSESSALHLLLSDGNLLGRMEVFSEKPGSQV
ncbi:hypothetical protein VULLAG_LOCUS2962 [Vulpes lagopus]